MGSVSQEGAGTAVTGCDPTTGQRGEGPAGGGGVSCVLSGRRCCRRVLGPSAHTGDRSTRWADWLLLSQGPSFVETVPGRVPFICKPRRVG